MQIKRSWLDFVRERTERIRYWHLGNERLADNGIFVDRQSHCQRSVTRRIDVVDEAEIEFNFRWADAQGVG